MQISKWIVSVIFWTIASGQDEDINPETQNYRYRYYVRDLSTGDQKSHEEEKIGSVVTGQYKLAEPNGGSRTVKYTADEGGFRADVKYEDGDSSGSGSSEKLGKESSPKSGYEFQWLPPNPDDITAAAKSSSEEISSDSENSNLPQTTGGSQESSTTEFSSLAPAIKEDEMPTVGESTPSLGLESSESGVLSQETSSNNGVSNDVLSEKDSSPSVEGKGDSSEEKTSSENPVPVIEGGSAEHKPDSSNEGNKDEPENLPESEEENKSGSDEMEPASNNAMEPKSEEAKAESAEAAESAPESAATEPNQMYLPPLPFQNLPFLNIPIPMGSPQIESNSPTIIYASQNFYNPWQWFGSRRTVREEPSSNEQSNPLGANPNFIPDLGYLIMPGLQQ